MAKDHFRDWGLYHKAVAALITALVLSVFVHAIFAIDSAYEVSDEIVIEANTADIWPWLIENKKRSDWQGEILKVVGTSVDVGRTQLVSWRRDFKHWRSYEVTTALVKERLFKSEHDMDTEKRWWQIELVPKGPCSTLVKYTETIQPIKYDDRFWFFKVIDARRQRLENSVKSLKKWVEKTRETCRDVYGRGPVGAQY